jgi:hypothetical protein
MISLPARGQQKIRGAKGNLVAGFPTPGTIRKVITNPVTPHHLLPSAHPRRSLDGSS